MPLSTIREQGAVNHRPVLSISILSYNQKNLLSRAIESVLDQLTDFPCEIIIGDDCSDDGSQEVLREYESRYPHLIYGIYHPRRYKNEVPGRTNNMTNLANCRGEFTAMLDGDDYYIDRHKLHRQVKVLTENQDLSMACHDSYQLWGPESSQPGRREIYSQLSMPTDMKDGIYNHEHLTTKLSVNFHISSLMFRSRLLRGFPAWFEQIMSADLAILYLLTVQGDYYYDTTISSVRYVGKQNFTNTTPYISKEGLRRRIHESQIFNRNFSSVKKNKIFKTLTARLHLKMAKICAKDLELNQSLKHFILSLRDIIPEVNSELVVRHLRKIGKKKNENR